MVDQITQNFINDLASVHIYVQPAPTPTPAPTQPPVAQESPDGTTVLAGSGGSITDANKMVWTISPTGVILKNGQPDTTTQNVIKLYYKTHEVYQENASNLWWVWRAAWVSVSDPTVVKPPASGKFKIASGKIYQPNGKEFIARGINVNDDQINTIVSNDACEPLLKSFPRLNCIRLNCRDYPTNVNKYEPAVTRLTNKGIVVWFDDHTGISQPPYTGAALQKEVDWFTMVARTYVNNQYVWINGFNEPSNGNNLPGVTDQQVAIYNGVRSVSPSVFVVMEEPCGGNPGLVGIKGRGYDGSGPMPQAAYTPMHNIIWGPHFYGWLSNYSNDRATVEAAFHGSIDSASGVTAAQSITSADNLVPVIIGEFGDSTTGNTIDSNGTLVVDVVGTSGYGFLAWHWRASTNPGDKLTNDDSGSLTPYGHQVADLILKAAAIEDAQPSAAGVYEVVEVETIEVIEAYETDGQSDGVESL
jgi:hypothetical protein